MPILDFTDDGKLNAAKAATKSLEDAYYAYKADLDKQRDTLNVRTDLLNSLGSQYIAAKNHEDNKRNIHAKIEKDYNNTADILNKNASDINAYESMLQNARIKEDRAENIYNAARRRYDYVKSEADKLPTRDWTKLEHINTVRDYLNNRLWIRNIETPIQKPSWMNDYNMDARAKRYGREIQNNVWDYTYIDGNERHSMIYKTGFRGGELRVYKSVRLTVKEYSVLPNSTQRAALNALGIDGFDSENFYPNSNDHFFEMLDRLERSAVYSQSISATACK